MSHSGITLALATYNQAELLAEFLQNYQAHGLGCVPLLVVDDGSTDKTPGILEEASLASRLRRITISQGGAARARNHALRACETPWIAFSDTDCVLDAEYFRLLPEIPARYAGQPAVEGAVLPPLGAKPPFTHSLFNATGGTYATANMAFHVPSILALGGFDEEFPANLREDTDLALTVLERHGAIPFWADWKVCHPHVPRRFGASLSQAWNRHDRMLRAEFRLYRKHPATYKKVRRFPSAAATLRNWCLRWSLLYLRECAAFLRSQEVATPAAWAHALVRCAEAAIVAGWEQTCIAFWWLTQWKNSPPTHPA